MSKSGFRLVMFIIAALAQSPAPPRPTSRGAREESGAPRAAYFSESPAAPDAIFFISPTIMACGSLYRV